VEGTIETSREVKRILGRVEGDRPGPTLLVTGGIHGNEWAGVEALERFLEDLQRCRDRLRGRVIAIAGNLEALARRTRYIEKDLNRQWTPEVTRKIRSGELDGTCVPEYREQAEILTLIHRTIDEVPPSEVYFIDLHTSSAEGSPFVTVGDTLRNRTFARRFRLPMILGLEEQVDGSLLEYINNLGYVTMGVEGGRHDSPASVDRIEAILWLAVVAARMLSRDSVPQIARSRTLLDEATRGVPRVIGVRYRHAIRPEDNYCMEPGYANFTPVEAGAVLGRDRGGEVRARETGLVMLPLYQGQGNDGFFLACEVRPTWLEISRILRRLRLNVLARFLPGIRRHPGRKGTLVVNKRIARYYPLEVLHLLGYRKVREQGNVLLVSRRRYDLSPPR
jgi:succinylglutamate desuccinylase